MMAPKPTQKGQSLVEATLVLVVFLSILFVVVDCGMALVAHQSMVERTRAAVRWGVVHPSALSGEQMVNWILYNQPEEPVEAREGYLGLTRKNIQVVYQTGSAEHPDDALLRVAIVGYHYQFLSPFLGLSQGMTSPRPVVISAPLSGWADVTMTATLEDAGMLKQTRNQTPVFAGHGTELLGK